MNTSPLKTRRFSVWIALLCAGLGVSSTTLAQSCTPVTGTDWIVTAAARDALAAPVRPADCAVVTQSPPDFGWPDMATDATYRVTLTYPDGRTRTLSAPLNWINWNEALPSGTYAWQVQVTSVSGAQTSLTRRFTVAAQPQPFLVPDAATVFDRVSAKAHPRSLPDAATLSRMIEQRQAGIGALRSAADAALTIAPLPEPKSSSAATNTAAVHDELKRTQNAGFAWVATKQTKYRDDAVRRLKNLAAWRTNGSTGYTMPGMSMAAREITWTMALVYDWLQPVLDSQTRRSVMTALQKRGQDLHSDVIGTRSRIAVRPVDSQGNVTLTVLASTAALLAGDLSEARAWLNGALPLSLNLLSPWGGPEGGNANGTTQGLWDVADSLVPWYALRWATGIDVGQKAWMRNLSGFNAYFLPPGTPAGSFGDGAEVARVENWSRFAKGATWLSPTPLGRWYVTQAQLQAEDPARLELLLAPPADFTTASFPAGTPNSAVFTGIGWAALHSDLADPRRTSVYFKSSPYGAFDHAHADQNSFVVNAGGERLAIDSGYYDAYKSPHWLGWYKLTKAHNAITFDSGQGQPIYESGGKVARGRITGHIRGTDYEIVRGDATPAYDGALTAAQRALIYLPPNLIVVYDKLASATGRQWEWNIHALNQMTNTSGTTARIASGSQSLCATVLGGPTTGFRQTNQFGANPGGSWNAQWHGTFYSTTRSTAAEFVTLLNVGCLADTTTPVPSATKTNDLWTVNVGRKTLFIDGTGTITVAPAGTTAPTTTVPAPTPVPEPEPEPTPTPTPPPTTTTPPTMTALTLASTGTRAVSTFHSLGLYWTPGSNPGTAGCRLQYKKSIDTQWQEGLAMWYDTRNSECRGSLVNLQSGTSYDMQFSLPGQAPARQLRTLTWSETFPIARTVRLPAGTSSQMFTITEGGSATGYVLYTTDPNTPSTIDVANGQLYNVQVNASYVIVRGLRLRGAQRDGVRIAPNVHDVVVEDNDISGWGRSRGTTSRFGYTLGVDMDSAVGANCVSTPGSLQRVIVQRNRLHDPRYGANSWTEGHPAGPQGITFNQCGGNHVFRYNEITSATGHYFNDGIGGAENFSTVGFPNADTDIYANIITHTWDDAIEAEGANRNVRIWGNYLDQNAIFIATTPTATGPVYVFRNVANRSRQQEGLSLDSDNRASFAKSGTISPYGGARRYLFHNTLLQARQDGAVNGLGAGTGVTGTGTNQAVDNTVSRNNIYHLWKTSYSAVYMAGTGNDFGHDLYSGSAGISMTNGMQGVPTYATGNGWTSMSGGMYQLASTSLGYDRGARVPNFNDVFTGTAPDVGAHEANTPAMLFGLSAATAAPPPTTTPTEPAPAPTPTPTPVPTTGPQPYGGTPIPIPGRIEAENFDLGGEGVAYHDTTTGNTGGAFRTTENVDVVRSCDPDGGNYAIGYTAAGEWLAYSVNVGATGNYDVALRVASTLDATIHLEIDGVNVTGPISGTNTGSWCTFKWTGKGGIPLTAGRHLLRFVIDSGYLDLNSIHFNTTR